MKTHRWFLTAGIAFVFCVAGFSSLLAQEDLSVIVKKIRLSVVVVSTYDNNGEFLDQGNGFFINNNGDVVTNIHALHGAASARVKTSYGKVYSVASILAEDREGDLIRVSVDIPPRIVHPLALSDSRPEVGEQVIVIGSPLGLEQKVFDGIVSSICKVPVFGTIAKITASISPGYNCSPVMNMKGEIIGIAVPQIVEGQSLNFVIHGERITRLLQGRDNTITRGVEDGVSEWFSSAERLCNNGIFYFAAEDDKNALHYFEEAGKKDPRYSHAYFYIGCCKDKLERYPEAIEAYKHAIRINPDFIEAHSNLGAACDRAGRYAEAVEAYRHVVRIQPEDVEFHYKLGKAYSALGRYAEAIKAFKQVIRMSPSFTEVYDGLGLAYYNLGSYAEAIEALKQATNIVHDNADTHSALGAAYNKQGCYTEAIESCKQAIRLKPDNAEAHYNLGMAYDKLGRYAEAIEAYRQAI
ncbi:MAG: tetratricopeptide repeat protein, partial [Planctomycetes bacterium]|nr:tetratricopeptide repeat protein [Planctomycetota bacterium]